MTNTTPTIDRRSVLKSLGAAGALITIGSGGIVVLDSPAAALASVPGTDTDTVLVTVFLRGALDGLSLVAPNDITDPQYNIKRPDLNVYNGGPVDETTVTLTESVQDRFLINTVASGLHSLWNTGELAIVHAAGIKNGPRSHFSAMDKMDQALAGPASGGWLIRALSAGLNQLDPWSALGAAASPNPSLRSVVSGGAPTVPSIDAIVERRGISPNRRQSGTTMYAGTRFGPVWSDALATTDLIFDVAATQPATADYYPEPDYDVHANRLADAARIINADQGVRAIAVDTNGWDTHQDQDIVLPPRIEQLSMSVYRFWHDLTQQSKQRTVLLVMSEFGRTLKQNGSTGTEHGSGNCMLVVGNNSQLNGGKVYLHNDVWPGLAPHQLREGRDLEVTTDFRDVFAEVVEAQFGAAAVTAALPGYTPETVGLFSD